VLLVEKLAGPYEAQDALSCVEPLLRQMCGEFEVQIQEGLKVFVSGACASEANGTYTAFQASKSTSAQGGSCMTSYGHDFHQ
jgi:hypothetical protein